MDSKVAVVHFQYDVHKSLERALGLIGKVEELNSSTRPLVIKVGVFDPKAENHTTVNVVDAIIKCFSKASKVYLAESDNYRGKALERLQIWKQLFSERVVPLDLSNDPETKTLKLAEEEICLSRILFKPNVLVSTHVLRRYERGSIMKNLFGLIPDRKKMKYHKKLDILLADIYEAIGGVDLAVLDGTYLFGGFGSGLHAGDESEVRRLKLNTLVVGRDAVAVDAVGAALAGLDPDKMSVIQEFVKRGFGEGNLRNIEIVGDSFERLKGQCAEILKIQKKMRRRQVEPQTWGGQAYRVMKILVEEDFFKLPNRRTLDDVARAFEAKGLSSKGNEQRIKNILARRVKNGVLKKSKCTEKWIYWAE